MITPVMLHDVPLFADLNDADVRQLAAVAADLRLVQGEWLVHEGELPAFFVLLEGDLEVTKMAAGTEHVINTYHPGDFFGEVPLLLGSTIVANLRALSEARVMRLEPHDFHTLMGRSDAVASRVLRTMSRRVADLQRLTVETPQATTLIIGPRTDVACYGLREFFSKNQLDFLWLDPENIGPSTPLPAEALGGPYPVVVLPDGTVLRRPLVSDLAERVGLQLHPPRDHYDVIIVGGGPAGLAAAVYGASEGLVTLLIEREAPGGQAGTSSRIENYLGFPTGLSGAELSARALQQARRFGTDIITTREVTGLVPGQAEHRVLLDGGEAVAAKAVILAMGVSWRPLPVAGVDRLVGRGIYYGAARTEAPNVQGEHVHLIGGGNSAGQAAMFFAGYAQEVTLLIRAPSVEQGMSQYLIDQLRTKRNVTFRLNTEVSEVHGQVHLTGITLRDRVTGEQERRDAGSLFVFIGADARTGWLPGEVVPDERGYVLTGLDAAQSGVWPLDRDPLFLETSVPGVFAAGDVRHGSIKRVASSVGEGSMAIALIHQYLALMAQGAVGAATEAGASGTLVE